jgi:hypothetical protein
MILNKNKGVWFDFNTRESFWLHHKPTLIDDYA